MGEWIAKQTSEVAKQTLLSDPVVPLEEMVAVLKDRLSDVNVNPKQLSSQDRYRPELPCPEAPWLPSPHLYP